MKSVVLLLIATLLAGCGQSFEPRRLAQSDTQLVVERVREQLDADLIQLQQKLYKRNPIQLKRGGSYTQAQRERMMLKTFDYPELGNRQDVAAIRLAFEPDFDGDRVFAFTYGLASLIDKSYGLKREFVLFDSVDEVAVFNSARNIDVAAYLLRTRREPSGAPYLYADGVDGTLLNASFSQLLGGMAAKQDVVADMLSDGDQRRVNSVARSVVTTVFLPIPF